MVAHMSYFLTDTKNVNTTELRLTLALTFIVSLILSFSQVLVDPVVNSDGILYLHTASLIQTDHWQAAYSAYNWLFYPLLIASFSSITSLSLEYSAYFINAFFSAITCATFVLVTHEFGGKNKTILFFASLIILCFPNFNEYRNMVIRDHGYWAFYLLSCYFFIRAFKHPSPKVFIYLTSTLLIASLFRVEGIIFLATLLPILFFHHKPTLTKTFIGIASVVFITFLAVLSFNNTQKVGALDGFAKIKQISQSIERPVKKIPTAIKITREYINELSPQGFSENYASAILFITIVLILLTEVLSSLSPLYALALSFEFFRRKNILNSSLFRPWTYLVLINFIVLCGFLISSFFLSGRYPIALALTLLTPLPFLALQVHQRFRSNQLSSRQKLVVRIIAIFFIALSLDGLISTGASKGYLRDAGQWIAALNKKSDVSLFTNNQFVSFYANSQAGKRIREPNFDNVLNEIKTGGLQKFDLLAIQISRKEAHEETDLLNALGVKPIKVFTNSRDDRILIFKQ